MKVPQLVAPVATHTMKHCTVLTFGGQQAPFLALENYLVGIPHRHAGHLIPPAGAHETGFRKILRYPSGRDQVADGAYVGQYEAVSIQSRDCPIVVIHDEIEGHTVVCHAGRPALSPAKFGQKDLPRNVLVPALALLTEKGSHPEHLTAYITAGISGEHFVHDGPSGWGFIVPFHVNYPGSVLCKKRTLNLMTVIRLELERSGVRPEAIAHDGLCTKTDPRLSSYRNGDRENNLVLVVRN